jgi:hypothetical protein
MSLTLRSEAKNENDIPRFQTGVSFAAIQELVYSFSLPLSVASCYVFI